MKRGVSVCLINFYVDSGAPLEIGPAADSSSDSDNDSEPATSSLALQQPQAQKKPAAASGAHQTEMLYQEAGQFNPHVARAEKKRRKRESKLGLGDDFDFAEAFADEVQISKGE